MRRMELDILWEEISLYKEYDFTSYLLYNQIGLENLKTNFQKYQFACVLRQCGMFSRSEELHQLIDYESVPINFKNLVHCERGFLYYDWCKFDKAQIHFRISIELGSESTIPYIMLSSILLKEENLSDSISLLEIALMKEGDLDEVNFNLGVIYSLQGDFVKSLFYFEECYDINPRFNELSNRLMDVRNCIQIISKYNL